MPPPPSPAASAPIVVEEPKVGIWPAAARGYDEAMADADIIARLDADSRPHPDWIARLVRAFVADPGLGVLTGGAEFYGGSPTTNYLGEHWYIGGGHYWIKKWLGIPLVFGSNFAMRTRVWERVRDEVDRTNARIHDDLDLTIRLRPADGVRYDPQLRMPVSARPVQTVGAVAPRLARRAATFAASWPEGAAWRRRELDGADDGCRSPPSAKAGRRRRGLGARLRSVALASVGSMIELTEEVLVESSVDVVARDFTDAPSVVAWIWPPRFESTAVVDPHPEGVWKVRSDVAELALLGRVLAVDAPRSLRLEWRWDGEEHTTDVEIVLEPAGGDATRVIVRHSGFQSQEERESHVEGWSDCLQRLAERHADSAG